ncbi:hypothetical protein P280DRAFT_126152 [Massarina eburnea CBS 473.64]|uniref:Prolyl 4-hydroxylase alpha subunit domain-containing protein n=1 Tax=Massarina eburnea CBS 473.64 TaxID=1395130 RepID=A0A6A6SD04_9PLEO|nr:hypothetical protein P280DRAFT_126152 [Massarina eburnea CBS 473.64]
MNARSSGNGSSPLSIWSLTQYGFFAVVAYILAGAPLQTLLTQSVTSGSARTGKAKWKDEFKVGGGNRARISEEKANSLVIPDRNLTCPEHRSKGVYVLSRVPLVVYLEGFLSDGEVKSMVDLSTPHFAPSTVWTAGQERLDPTVRLSEKAQVPRSSRTVQCIEERARAFQGWRPYVFIEKMWAQKYGAGGHYSYHYDWGNAVRGAGRISSFMVWLGDACEGGGTKFPRLEMPMGGEWCRFIECDGGKSKANAGADSANVYDEEEGTGITFKPIKGNAVYWENMNEDGTGYEESWHAGLPVTNGEKIGLNIWSWYQEGWDPYTEEGVAETKR